LALARKLKEEMEQWEKERTELKSQIREQQEQETGLFGRDGLPVRVFDIDKDDGDIHEALRWNAVGVQTTPRIQFSHCETVGTQFKPPPKPFEQLRMEEANRRIAIQGLQSFTDALSRLIQEKINEDHDSVSEDALVQISDDESDIIRRITVCICPTIQNKRSLKNMSTSIASYENCFLTAFFVVFSCFFFCSLFCKMTAWKSILNCCASGLI
jgi:hypothetical protein